MIIIEHTTEEIFTQHQTSQTVKKHKIKRLTG